MVLHSEQEAVFFVSQMFEVPTLGQKQQGLKLILSIGDKMDQAFSLHSCILQEIKTGGKAWERGYNRPIGSKFEMVQRKVCA